MFRSLIRPLIRRRFSKVARDRRDYDRACAGILKTPPLDIRDAPLRFLSMMCHRDVIPYLVAIKSLYHAVGEGRIVLVDDGSLTADDRALFNHHLGSPAFIHIKEIDSGVCPRGGCWERLLQIIDITSDHYVIQVDADTVTMGDASDVIRCYRENRSFTLSTPTGRNIASVEQAAEFARNRMRGMPAPHHIQIVAEAVLDQLPEAGEKRYVRGSAGFAGFAVGAVNRADANLFSEKMSVLVGKERWSDWGTEQVTSNFLVANAPDAVVLPSPAYECFLSNADWHNSTFLHFIGSHRYKEGVYKEKSLEAIERLKG